MGDESTHDFDEGDFADEGDAGDDVAGDEAQPTAEAKLGPKPKPKQRRYRVPLHPAVEAKMLEHARQGAPDSMLSALLGMGRNALAHWRKLAGTGLEKHCEYKRIVGLIEQKRAELDLQYLADVNAIAPTDWRVAQWRLGCRYPELSERRLAARDAALLEAERLKAEAEAAKAAAASEDVISHLDPEFLKELALLALANLAARRKAALAPKAEPEGE